MRQSERNGLRRFERNIPGKLHIERPKQNFTPAL